MHKMHTKAYKTRHTKIQILLFILLGFSGTIFAQDTVLSACTPAAHKDDPKAPRVALIQAITQSLRDTNSPTVSGHTQLSNSELQTKITSEISAKVTGARIIQKTFVPATESQAAKICIQATINPNLGPIE